MTSWRPLVTGTVGLFLIILAFLAGQLKGGGDPALGQSRPTAIEQTTPQPQQESPSFSGPDDTDPGTTPDAAPPTTQQS
jgi:hypothetical protein